MRPKTFAEVAGQDLNKKILMAIVKNPEEAPSPWFFKGFMEVVKQQWQEYLLGH